MEESANKESANNLAPDTQATSNQQEFKNENIHVVVTRKPGCTASIDVEVFPTAVKFAKELAMKAVKKEVSIPGFRKGKVPDEMLKHNFASAITQQLHETVVDTGFREMLKLTNLKPFTRNSLKRSEIKKISADDGAKLHFELEVEPEVPAIDYQSVQSKVVEPRPLNEKVVERSYRQLQIMHATWEAIEGRACKLGDFVELDIDVTQHPAHNVCVNQLFLVQPDELPKWLLDTVIGMQVDESREVEAKPDPQDPPYVVVYENDQSPKQCRVSLKTIKKANLMPEDETFAKKFGASSVEELKKFIEARLNREEQEYAHELSRYNLRRELLQKYPFDLPRSLVDSEVRGRLAYVKQGGDIAKGGLPQDAQKEKDLRTQIESEARGFFMWMFMMRQVTPQAEITVSQPEMEQEYNHQMQLPRQQRLIYAGLAPDEVRNRLVMLIMMRKCEDYLLGLRQTAQV